MMVFVCDSVEQQENVKPVHKKGVKMLLTYFPSFCKYLQDSWI